MQCCSPGGKRGLNINNIFVEYDLSITMCALCEVSLAKCSFHNDDISFLSVKYTVIFNKKKYLQLKSR